MQEPGTPTAPQTDTLIEEPRNIECSQAELTASHPELFSQPEDIMSSPPENEEAIQAFTFDTAKVKLDALPFSFGADIALSKSQGDSQNYSNPDGFQIPVSRIIAANGYFGDRPPSWSGRAGGYESDNGVSSLNRIIDYAKQGKYEQGNEMDKIVAEVVYGPNGEPFYILVGGNHRGSAAKLRGDVTLSVKYIHVRNPQKAVLARDDLAAFYGETLEKHIPAKTNRELGLLSVEEWRKSMGVQGAEPEPEPKPAPPQRNLIQPTRHKFFDRFRRR